VVQGIVTNTGPAPAAGIVITVSLIGDNGAVVKGAQASSALRILSPKARSPWPVYVNDAPPFKEVCVQVQARPPGAKELYTHELKPEQITVRPAVSASSSARIDGQILNTGQTAARGVRVVTAIFEPDGTLLEIGETAVKVAEIMPARSAAFDLELSGRGIKVFPKYDFFVEGMSPK